ncbi:MAG TPA: hypothetical protein VF998_07055 [Candidatus Limnocylindria bacterium]
MAPVAPPITKPVAVPQPPPEPAGEPARIVLRQPVRTLRRLRERPATLELSTAGVRISDERTARTIGWRDLGAISISGGVMTIVTPAGPLRLVPAIEGVSEPALSAQLAQVLERGRSGELDPHTGALHDLLNKIDRAMDDFAEADDPVVPLAVGVFGAVSILILVIAIPSALQIIAFDAPPPATWVIQSKVSFLDPRTLVASLAGAAALAAVVARFGVGPQALTWARGTLRGWHRGRSGLEDRARAVLARVLLVPRQAAIVSIVAAFTLVPSAFAHTVIDGTGFHGASGLPLLSSERAWSEVSEVYPISVEAGERPEGLATVFVFADGSRLSTREGHLLGGTERKLLEFALAHAR